jgi:hypothetical protein
MLPEYVLATMAAALLGWGTFAWKRAEDALLAARTASVQTEKLELKVAETYLTKREFELSMERLFSTLSRFEDKLDYHVYQQDERINDLKDRLRQAKKDDL